MNTNGRSWAEIVEKEGCIYCQKKNTWCAYVNQKTGECDRGSCPSDGKEVEENG
ncbi:MAG TPA: hypothetical protein VFC41_01810 [Anaerovoracaceae bacterium]|nr:hypothetical protein [Anaerovoracaceae bacterium]